MKKLEEKTNIIFVVLLIMSMGFGFSTFKIVQSKTATNYKHSKNCYVDHYLELDCFDSCSGVQVHAPSHHHHNNPYEVNMVAAFDALLTHPLKIVALKHPITIIPASQTSLFFMPFLKQVFRPPFLG